MYVGAPVKYPLILSDFNETWIYVTDFKKNKQISNLKKVHIVWAELFQVEKNTDTYGKANSSFSYMLQTHLKTKMCLTKFQFLEVLDYKVGPLINENKTCILKWNGYSIWFTIPTQASLQKNWNGLLDGKL